MTTLEKIAAIMFDGLEPGTKAYYKAEYYMGQAIAQYGAEDVLRTMVEGEQIEQQRRSKSAHENQI
jgi:hypothetical protein